MYDDFFKDIGFSYMDVIHSAVYNDYMRLDTETSDWLSDFPFIMHSFIEH